VAIKPWRCAARLAGFALVLIERRRRLPFHGCVGSRERSFFFFF
jgi:hypothetical protein